MPGPHMNTRISRSLILGISHVVKNKTHVLDWWHPVFPTFHLFVRQRGKAFEVRWTELQFHPL